MGMAELIDKWEVVSKLITLQNNYNFFKNEWDAERLYREIAKLEIAVGKTQGLEVVRCKDCKHWHEETNWCTKHSHFVGRDGMACHPSQSSEWKMFNADDFCSYGERKSDG